MAEDESDGEYFVEKASDEDILNYVKQEEVVTTKEVAEHFEYHLQTARRRLKGLEEEESSQERCWQATGLVDTERY
ncbi:DeoR family transcriptional regulator [Halomicroarcula sp. GCM10025710]